MHWPTVLLLSILYATLKYLSISFDWGESLNTYEKLQDEASSDGVEVISDPFRTDEIYTHVAVSELLLEINKIP